jgi:hypothetical protein
MMTPENIKFKDSVEVHITLWVPHHNPFAMQYSSHSAIPNIVLSLGDRI